LNVFTSPTPFRGTTEAGLPVGAGNLGFAFAAVGPFELTLRRTDSAIVYHPSLVDVRSDTSSVGLARSAR
jgi:hypothetical protein